MEDRVGAKFGTDIHCLRHAQDRRKGSLRTDRGLVGLFNVAIPRGYSTLGSRVDQPITRLAQQSQILQRLRASLKRRFACGGKLRAYQELVWRRQLIQRLEVG